MTTTVLFLCTNNSARSLMAEALLRHRASDRFDVVSAGSRPTNPHPLAVQALAELGLPTESMASKGIDRFMGKRLIERAIIVCERVEPDCPRIFPFAFETLHWPFADPVPERSIEAFRAVRDAIDQRIVAWLSDTRPRAGKENSG